MASNHEHATMRTASQRPVAEINTRRVAGRRQVHYHSLDDLLADAQQLAAGPHRTLGNWSYGMILRHLAQAINMGLDGATFNVPRPVQILATLLFKKRFLRGPMKPGYKLPKKAGKSLVPPETSTEQGLALLTSAIHRWQQEPQRMPHPIFGSITPDEWSTLALRHAEMHMSFVVPDQAS